MSCWWPCCTEPGCGCAASQVFLDHFSSALGGYTDTACIAGTAYSISGGLLLPGNNHVYTQSIARPALNGLCISVQAVVNFGNGTGTGGVTIGGTAGAAFFIRVSANVPLQYGRNDTFATGCIAGTDFAAFNPVCVSGDTIKLKIADVSSGGGTYDVCFYVNGTLVRTESAKALTIPDPFEAGVTSSSPPNVTWDDLLIETN